MVYLESYEDRHEALSRECRIKRMNRAAKEKLIAGREENPGGDKAFHRGKDMV